MLFSIVVPAYNAEKWLGNCFDSIAAQNYRDFEVILVDDGSSDNTAELAKQYESHLPCLRVVVQENKGALLARKTGVERAKGEYILFADADDNYCAPNVLDRLASKIEAYRPELIIFNITDLQTGKAKTNIFPAETFFIDSDLIVFREQFLHLSMIHLHRKCIKRELLFADGFDYSPYSHIIGEDLLLSFRIVDSARSVLYLPCCLYNYRKNEKSITFSPVTASSIFLWTPPVLSKDYFFFLHKWIPDQAVLLQLESFAWRWFYLRLFDAFSRMLLTDKVVSISKLLHRHPLMTFVNDALGEHLHLSGLSLRQRLLVRFSNKGNILILFSYRMRLRISRGLRSVQRRIVARTRICGGQH